MWYDSSLHVPQWSSIDLSVLAKILNIASLAFGVKAALIAANNIFMRRTHAVIHMPCIFALRRTEPHTRGSFKRDVSNITSSS